MEHAGGIRGFGLLQRDTLYEHYLDSEAQYHRRPSVWVEPVQDWGAGAVELLELPGVHEGIDNIAAWWTPSRTPQVGQPFNLAYRVSFFSGALPQQEVGRAIACSIRRSPEGPIELDVDFSGTAIASLHADAKVSVETSAVRGRVTSTSVSKLPDGQWRATLVVEPTRDGPVELTATLKDSGASLTETWSYLCAVSPPEYKFPQVYTRQE
jgi:glucans biosynthesis protein